MNERRLPFSVRDDEGATHRGELIIVGAWEGGLAPSPGAAFAIVLAQRPSAGEIPAPEADVAVCLPAALARLPAAAAEPAAAYGAMEERAPLRLSRAAANAFAKGALIADAPLAVDAADVFGGAGQPRLELVAKELVATSKRAGAYWRAIDDVLSWPKPAARSTPRQRVRSRLRAVLEGAPASPGSEGALEKLRAIVEGRPPAALAPSPGELADHVAFARCLAERPEAAAEVARWRAYLDGATPGAQMRSLQLDQAVTREQLSFVTLLAEPHRLESMRASFEVFHSEYATAYVEHHRRHWRAMARLAATLDEAAPAAQALTRLNTLRALGRPLGRTALASYARVRPRSRRCRTSDLAAALRTQPVCADCAVSMEDAVPAEEAEETLRGLRAALGRQQARLASEAVRRILARGGQRIGQFLAIIQASDLAGLAQVLDDELLAFLRELLDEPLVPAPEALDLFQELVRAHPVVSEGQLDAVTETLRRLLAEQLASQHTADPSRPAAVRLASAPAP